MAMYVLRSREVFVFTNAKFQVISSNNLEDMRFAIITQSCNKSFKSGDVID